MKSKQVYFAIPALAVAMLLLAGCEKKDPAAVVQQRAVERWNLLATHQAVKAYEYLSPGYRESHTLDQYVAFVATARLKWQSAKVTGQQCDAEACTVHLTVSSAIPGQLAGGLPHDIAIETPITENWVSSGGQWYFLPDLKVKLSGNAAAANDATQGQGDGSTSQSPAPATAPAGQAAPGQPPQNEGGNK